MMIDKRILLITLGLGLVTATADVGAAPRKPDPKPAPKAKNPGLVHKWRCALILHGVDMSQNHGWVSAVHTDRELEETVQAVGRAVADLQAEGAV